MIFNGINNQANLFDTQTTIKLSFVKGVITLIIAGRSKTSDTVIPPALINVNNLFRC
ncbi:hypothetical protein GAPWKB11_1148 [Gilliamella apicola]|jgi:hypothetical protein|nr:hypothetical protein GAPWKB11_1148 [Gilliamella apicola]